MNQINKRSCKTISAKAKAALETVAEELGLEVEVQGGRFDPVAGTYRPKIEFAIPGAEKREFELSARLFGFEPSDYMREFTSGGKKYRLVGFNHRARSMPYLAKSADGRNYKFRDVTFA